MSDTKVTVQQVLARLEVAEQKLAQYETVHSRRHYARRPKRRRWQTMVALPVVLLLALVPLSLLAAASFDDLTGSVHDPDIEAIYAAGVTTGCIPDQSYCPTEQVTRQEMASFLARLGGLGNNAPVANAARLATTNPTATSPTFAADELAYAASTSFNESLVLSDTAQLYGPLLTITAPSDGFVLVNAVTKFTYVSGTCDPCNSTVLVVHTQSGTLSTASAVSVEEVVDYRVADPITWLFPVSAGVNTFELQVRKSTLSPGTGVVEANAAFTTALFVPFGALGSSGGASAVPEGAPADR